MWDRQSKPGPAGERTGRVRKADDWTGAAYRRSGVDEARPGLADVETAIEGEQDAKFRGVNERVGG
jgi:hypothetical protein